MSETTKEMLIDFECEEKRMENLVEKDLTELLEAVDN
jgi:hypothetical protein